MKIRPLCLILALSMLGLLAISGCKEDRKTTTKINRDGSCERIFVLKSLGDTSSAFPYPSGLSWKDTEKPTTYRQGFSV